MGTKGPWWALFGMGGCKGGLLRLGCCGTRHSARPLGIPRSAHASLFDAVRCRVFSGCGIRTAAGFRDIHLHYPTLILLPTLYQGVVLGNEGASRSVLPPPRFNLPQGIAGNGLAVSLRTPPVSLILPLPCWSPCLATCCLLILGCGPGRLSPRGPWVSSERRGTALLMLPVAL